jgi:hypothetical protein
VGSNKVVKSSFNEFRKVIRQVLVTDVVEVVVVRILSETAIEVRPGEDILNNC